MRNPFEIVDWFEQAVAQYTGAPYAVATDSCTNAILLTLKYIGVGQDDVITIPKRTYLSVPQSILQAGAKLKFEDLDWQGIYKLKPFSIYDAAKRFTFNMYIPGSYMCLSFHHKKHLPIGKGGMILTDCHDAYWELRKMRYEGRTPKLSYHQEDNLSYGINAYMTPEEAARGLTLLWNYPKKAADLIEDPPYRDLTELFK